MTKKNLIHAILKCAECSFYTEDYLSAQKKGTEHAVRRGGNDGEINKIVDGA